MRAVFWSIKTSGNNTCMNTIVPFCLYFTGFCPHRNGEIVRTGKVVLVAVSEMPCPHLCSRKMGHEKHSIKVSAGFSLQGLCWSNYGLKGRGKAGADSSTTSLQTNTPIVGPYYFFNPIRVSYRDILLHEYFEHCRLLQKNAKVSYFELVEVLKGLWWQDMKTDEMHSAAFRPLV